MSFYNPIWLWGLMGLAIPVAIHFLSRKESKVIRLGSLRHLQDSITNQSVNIRLNELLLLLLRCLLILTTVLLLSGLSFSNHDSSARKWLLIEPGVDQKQFSLVIDSLKNQGFITKQFIAGFPDTGNLQQDSSVNYWALTEQIEKYHVSQAVVISKNLLEGFKGKRIPLPANVTWLAADSDSSKFNLTINSSKSDSVVIRRANSNAYLTSFTNENQPAGEPSRTTGAAHVSVKIVSDSKYSYDRDVVVAALRAVDKNSIISIDVKSISVNEYNPTDSTDWTVWLTDQKTHTLKANEILIDTIDKSDNMPLLLKGDCAKPCWKIVRRLNIQTALREKLVFELSSIILDDAKKALHIKSTVHDKRTLPEKLVWSASSKTEKLATSDQSSNTDSAVPLFVLMILLLTSERWLALKRNQ